MQDAQTLTRQLLGYRLSRPTDPKIGQTLATNYFEHSPLYVVAAPATTLADWEAKTFGVYVEKHTAYIFLDKEDAERMAIEVGSVLSAYGPMVMKAPRQAVYSMLSTYARQDQINSVCLCGIPPVRAYLPVEEVLRGHAPETPSTVMAEETPATISKTSSERFALAGEVRAVLDMAEAKKRREVDSGNNYSNIHKLIEKLVYTNGIEMSELDKTLDLPAGFTKQFCADVTGSSTPKAIIEKYLAYFELSPYLFAFADQCQELKKELSSHAQIDQYELKPATLHTSERFKLEDLVRGTNKHGCYVYQIKLKSRSRVITTIVSNHFGLVVGKEYEIPALEPTKEKMRDAAQSDPVATPSQEEEEQILEKLKKNKKGPTLQGKESDLTPEQRLEKAKEEILAYLIRLYGCNSRDAQRKLSKLEDEQDIIINFARYIKSGHSGNFLERGYSPEKLIRELHYDPYDAYCVMADLKHKPKQTLQLLKYRERDPQYQKQPASVGG